MRVLHLSDIHYCQTGHESFNRYFDNLLKELDYINAQKPIDCVFLTGDLIDKGGHAFKRKDRCFHLFNEIFVDKLISRLKINKHNFIFIPGNHDIDRDKIDDPSESGMAKYTIARINDFAHKNRDSYSESTKRIKKFKTFEKEFYNGHKDYYHSIYESCWVCNIGDIKVGVVGLNSAWRCSSNDDKQDGLQMAAKTQINKAVHFLKGKNTDFNIALLHHPIEQLASHERDDIQKYLTDAKISIVFGGHTHKTNHFKISRSDDAIFQILARIGFNSGGEENESFQSGFTVVDFSVEGLNAQDITITSNFYKYVESLSGFRFDVDTQAGRGGKTINHISKNYASENFLQFVRAKPSNELSITEQNKIKNDFYHMWNTLTSALIRTSFLNISDKLIEKIKHKMLPEKLNFYHINHNFTYVLDDYDGEHTKLVEKQEFIIKTDNNLHPFRFKDCYVVEKQNNSLDKSDLIIKICINGVDYSNEVKKTDTIVNLSDTIKIVSLWDIELQGSTEYFVELEIHSIHTNTFNGYWRANISEITEGVKVTPPKNDMYEIDTICFTKGLNIEDNTITSPNISSKGMDILMPGDGFIIVFKRKI